MARKQTRTLKPLPKFASDDAAHEWLQSTDLTEYDTSGGIPFKEWLVGFEALHKDGRVNLRLPRAMIEQYKAQAAKLGVPYQRLMRDALTRGLSRRRAA